MKISYDKNRNIAYIKLTGELGRESILSAFDKAVSDPNYKDGMGRLWDFRDADLTNLDTNTIFEMAQYSLKFPPGINDVKVAFVAGTEVVYGLSRMFELVSEAKTPIAVFRSMGEAEIWLME